MVRCHVGIGALVGTACLGRRFEGAVQLDTWSDAIVQHGRGQAGGAAPPSMATAALHAGHRAELFTSHGSMQSGCLAR